MHDNMGIQAQVGRYLSQREAERERVLLSAYRTRAVRHREIRIKIMLVAALVSLLAVIVSTAGGV